MSKQTPNSAGPTNTFSGTIVSTDVVPTGVIPMDEAGAKRQKRIAEAAYKRAEQRGFAPGHDLSDWLEAEKEIDSQDGGFSR